MQQDSTGFRTKDSINQMVKSFSTKILRAACCCCKLMLLRLRLGSRLWSLVGSKSILDHASTPGVVAAEQKFCHTLQCLLNGYVQQILQ